MLSAKSPILRSLIYFYFGFTLVLGLLQFTGVNLLEIWLVNLSDQAHRTYINWLFYNPYDFFVFLGIPISLLFISQIKNRIWDSAGKLNLAFWAVFVALIWGGFSRGEVGRTWLPLMFIPVVLVVKSLTRKQFTWILILVLIQTLVMQEFWVPIW